MTASTIAAVSTPQAAGGIGIIRISGPRATEVADRVFTPLHGKKPSEMRGWTCALGHIADGGGVIDECIATVFRAPRSYTGEDVVELSCHGGLYVTKRALRAVLACGAEPAGAGEFTKRAYLNGRIDLTRAEAVMNVISAEGEAALSSAVSALDGETGRRIGKTAESLIHASAAIAMWTDDPDEDVPAAHPEDLRAVIVSAKAELEKLIANFDNGKAVTSGVDTVICGCPNVGKSTLMNMLSGEEKSIVTDIPGTTRDIVEQTVRAGDVLLRLSDTAGIREDADTVEAIGVDRALKKIGTAELIIAVFDGSIELGPEDISLLEKCRGRRAVAVVNKSDKGVLADLDIIRERVPETVVISAGNREGADKLYGAISRVTGAADFAPGAGTLVSERQRACCAEAAASLEEALCALDAGVTLDAVNISVDWAVDRLLELTGKKTRDAVVDEVFAKFCVGK